ncbi:Bacterial cellulose synthase subunit [compost metagenome]
MYAINRCARASHSRLTSSSSKLLPLIGLLTLCTLATQARAADGVGRYFQQMAVEQSVTRQVTLKELGITAPMIFTGADSQRELFLPVPAGIPVNNAALQFGASYLRADGGRTSMTLSVDGYPVVARRLAEDQGDLSQGVAIAGQPRTDGFVRFGIHWSSVISENVCSDQRAPGNALRVEPGTRFTYSYDRSAIKSIATAWSALPPNPVLLVSGKNLTADAYDTAWRMGLTLKRAGKRPRWMSVPAVGDTVNLSAISVPPELRGIPSFASLMNGDTQYKIKNNAEIAALFILGNQGPFRADLIVADAALNTNLRNAMNALGAEIQAISADASAIYQQWLKSDVAILDQPNEADQVRLASFIGSPVIMVSAKGGQKASALFDTLWRPIAASKDLTVEKAEALRAKAETVLLSQFGAINGTLEVSEKSERAVNFEIGELVGSGRLPSQVVFDVSAAPGTSGEAPVVSIFLNDYLLGARVMAVDGKPHRIAVDIPYYTLAARNTIRIAFVRQPSKIHCHDVPSSFPVAIFPGSHLKLKQTAPGNNFVGIAARYAKESSLIVKEEWLKDALAMLPLTVRVADAAGLSSIHTQFSVVKPGEVLKPTTPFLALDVPLDDKHSVQAHDGMLVLNGAEKTPILQLKGLDRLAVAEVIEVNGQSGIHYYTVGKTMPVLSSSFRLAHGNLAVITDAGPVLQIDKNDPTDSRFAKEDNPQSLWQRHMEWWLAAIAVIIFILISARVARVRRNKRKQAESQGL